MSYSPYIRYKLMKQLLNTFKPSSQEAAHAQLDIGGLLDLTPIIVLETGGYRN